MPKLTVVRPREVTIYICDNVHCDSECDSPFPDMPGDNPWTAGTVSEGCGWIAIPSVLRTKHDYTDAQYTSREFSRSDPLYFCEWECLATWAQDKAVAEGQTILHDAPAAA